MTLTTGRVYAVTGTLLTLTGMVCGFTMFLKPWRSCPEIDDGSAGCPGTSAEAALLAGAFVVFAVGTAVLLIALKSSTALFDIDDAPMKPNRITMGSGSLLQSLDSANRRDQQEILDGRGARARDDRIHPEHPGRR